MISEMPKTPKSADFAEFANTGLMTGARILTMNGYVSVDTLTPGDRIVTRSGVATLRTLHTHTQLLNPVIVAQSALGYSRPESQLFVAPEQEVYVRDWRAQALFGCDQVIMPVSRLVDDKFIKWGQVARTYQTYHLGFNQEEVFYADGVELLSFQHANAKTNSTQEAA